MVSIDEVVQHNSAKSCWVIIEGRVYDVTEFLPNHPGGTQAILKYAGRDATEVYTPIHPSDALKKHIPPSKQLGALSTIRNHSAGKRETKDVLRVKDARKRMPPLNRIINLTDMENVARGIMSHKALAYYSSAADDEITYVENSRAFVRFFFRPRVMRPVSKCDPSTTILGFSSSIPVFVSAAALATLGHPDGEVNITKGAFQGGIIQMVSSNASLSPCTIKAAASFSQTLFFQLYKHRDDRIAETRVREVESLGYKAIFLTVDAIVASNRERDIRSQWLLEEEEYGPVCDHSDDSPKIEDINVLGTAGAFVANDDRDMMWQKTIPWLRSVTTLPIVVKGIQCVEDAVLAADAGVDGILLSNHGGRQLDCSLPPMEVLYSLRQRRPDLFGKLEIYLDGGIRRGTDVIKSLCLGARAVGLGRAFLYAQSAYGVAGVSRIIEILRREILIAMRLLGASTVQDLCPEMIERVNWEPYMPAKL